MDELGSEPRGARRFVGSLAALAVIAAAVAVAVGPADGVAPDVRPVLECVDPPAGAGQPYRAHFGYLNEYTSVQTIAAGPGNRLVPALPASPALPTEFQVGRQRDVFTVEFDGSPLVWVLTDPDGTTRTSTASASSVPCAPPCVELGRLGMIGWWQGQDSLESVVGPDLSGLASFGVGRVGRGVSLDGSGGASAVGLATVSSAVSVEAWIKPTDNGRVQSIVSRWAFPSLDDSARSFHLMLVPGGRLVFETDETSARRPHVVEAVVPQLLDGGFHHVAATWTPALVTIYVDGVAVVTASSQGGRLNPASQVQLAVGGKSGMGDPFGFTGVIDEPTVWNRALNATEIAAIHAAGQSGKCASSTVPVQEAGLVAIDGASGNWLGWSVDVDGSTVVAGARQDDDAGSASGSAYVFTGVNGAWGDQVKLTASDAGAGDAFGVSVAVDGDTAVVGAPGDDDGGFEAGSAYVFTRSAGVWTQQAKLVASDAALGDQLGWAVSVDGDTVVVGAPGDDDGGFSSGSAYVFTRSGGVWSEEAKLVAGDGVAFDQLGWSVAVEGDTAALGAYGDDSAGTDAGSAYVFTRSAGVWSQQAELTAATPAVGDALGWSVALSGDTIVAGAHLDDGVGADGGSAHVFTRSGGVWSVQAELTASDGAAFDYFGRAVAISGDRVVVGAHLDDDAGGDSGSTYLFARSGATWTQRARFTAADTTAGDWFGFAVAVDGVTAVVGAMLDDTTGTDSGSVSTYRLPTP